MNEVIMFQPNHYIILLVHNRMISQLTNFNSQIRTTFTLL